MWPLYYFKSRLAAFIQHTVRIELQQKSMSYASAKNLVDVIDMQVSRMETDTLKRLDELENRLEALEVKLSQDTDEA